MKYELYIGKHCHTITGPDGLAIHFIANDLAEAERVARLMFAAVDDEAGRECDGQFGQLAMRLRRYNEWRRGADFEQPHPEELGRDIDSAIDVIKLLEQSLRMAAEEPNIDKARAIADAVLMPNASITGAERSGTE